MQATVIFQKVFLRESWILVPMLLVSLVARNKRNDIGLWCHRHVDRGTLPVLDLNKYYNLCLFRREGSSSSALQSVTTIGWYCEQSFGVASLDGGGAAFSETEEFKAL